MGHRTARLAVLILVVSGLGPVGVSAAAAHAGRPIAPRRAHCGALAVPSAHHQSAHTRRQRHRAPSRRTRAQTPCKDGRRAAALVSSGAPAQIPFGFNDNAVAQGLVTPQQDAQLASEGGATVERVTFDWRWVEPHQGQFNFGMYDRIYAAMTARGIRPLWVFLFAPSWALSSADACDQFTTNCMYPPAPEHYLDAGSMAAMIATRYPQSAGIEVWNEPNLSFFWRPAPDPAAFTSLLVSLDSAVKAADPSMPVVMGGLSDNQTWANHNWPLESFLGAAYYYGARGHMDAVGVHPYPGNSGTDLSMVSQAMQQARDVRSYYSDLATPMWATEAGVSTNGASTLTDSQQATNLTYVYDTLAGMPDVKLIAIHTLIEPGQPFTSEWGYGVVTQSLEPRLAFCALASLRHSGFRCGG
jgi:polysaccharide biosynthesis protein PslG